MNSGTKSSNKIVKKFEITHYKILALHYKEWLPVGIPFKKYSGICILRHSKGPTFFT